MASTTTVNFDALDYTVPNEDMEMIRWMFSKYLSAAEG